MLMKGFYTLTIFLIGAALQVIAVMREQGFDFREASK
jgi:hypothetical protein